MAKCSSCLQENINSAKYCTSCGKALLITDSLETGRRGISQTNNKTKTTAGILAFLLGGLGVHKFYIGSWGWGIVYLVLVFTGIPAILGIIEAIMFFVMEDRKFDQLYNNEPSTPFKW